MAVSIAPIVLNANKGRTGEDGHSCSFSTATCDGLLALLAAGEERDDARLLAAGQWLQFNTIRAGTILQAFHETILEPWGQAVFFYHLSVRAKVYSAIGGPDRWQSELVEVLKSEQRDDGSFLRTALR